MRATRPCPENCAGDLGVPSNAGTFVSSYDIFGASVELLWEQLIHGDEWEKRRADRKAARAAKKRKAGKSESASKKFKF